MALMMRDEVRGLKARPYRCPGCDREAFVFVTRTSLHRYGNNGLVYSISCRRHEDQPFTKGGALPNSCLGSWFSLRPFHTETNAVSEWNNCIIEMAASALGISERDARALKEGRATVAHS